MGGSGEPVIEEVGQPVMALYLAVWLAMCSFHLVLFEVDALAIKA